MTVAIITDSGCDLPPGTEQQLQVAVVDLIFRFGLEEFRDKSIPMGEFLERVKRIWPTTSAPSPGDYMRVMEACLKDHESAICITVSGQHSAAYSSAVLASEHFEPGRVVVVDSESLSIGQGLLVQEAALAALNGASQEEILAKIRDMQKRSHLYIILDTVEFLVRGGRASQLLGILAGVLQIRPVLTLVRGKLTLYDRPRGRKASKQKLLDLAASHFPAQLAIAGHVACEGEARELAALLAQVTGYPESEIGVIETGMAIASHGGPGTLGFLIVSRS